MKRYGGARRKLVSVTIMVLMLMGVTAASAFAEQLPENCERDRGTVTCTTFEGPGKNQGGVGHTVEDDTKGNTKNKNPEPQDLRDDECVDQHPPKSKGQPIACPD